jgi:hypothetical protein
LAVVHVVASATMGVQSVPPEGVTVFKVPMATVSVNTTFVAAAPVPSVFAIVTV